MGVGWSEGLPMTESAALPMLCSCATAVTETKQVYMRTVMIFLFFCLWKGVYRRTVRISTVEFYETSTLYELSWLRWGI